MRRALISRRTGAVDADVAVAALALALAAVLILVLAACAVGVAAGAVAEGSTAMDRIMPEGNMANRVPRAAIMAPTAPKTYVIQMLVPSGVLYTLKYTLIPAESMPNRPAT